MFGFLKVAPKLIIRIKGVEQSLIRLKFSNFK